MNEEETQDTLGAAHIALLLAREPVARSIVERFDANNPPYADPNHISVFQAAKAMMESGQAPSLDNIRFCLAKWVEMGDESYAGALAVLDAEPTEESVTLDSDAAEKRAVELEAEMAGRTEPAEPKPMYELLSLEELAALPPQEYLIQNVLVDSGTSLLTAKHRSFKSFISLDMALCVATGRKWHGHEVKQGPVLYVAAEGAAGLIKRVQAWCIENGEAFPKDFRVIAIPTKIHQPVAQAGLLQACDTLKPALVVLDTLARCAVGLNENDSNEMGQFADALGMLARESGAHFMIVHHNNKSGDYRGSTSIPAAADSHFSMSRTGQDDSVIFKCEKQKDEEDEWEIVFSRHVVQVTPEGKTSLIFRREYAEDDFNPYGGLSGTEQKILAALIEGWGYDGTTFTNWWGLIEADGGISKSSFIRAKQKLLDNGNITSDGKERGPKFKPVKKES